MLQLIHPALPRAVADDSYRLRQSALVVSATVVALGLLISTTVTSTLATAAQQAELEPANQVFVTVPVEPNDTPASIARDAFTIDARPPLQYPVGAGAPLGSPYGPRAAPCAACPSLHNGVDWNPGYGHPVVSIADGVVRVIGSPASALGVHLEIDHVVNGQPVTSVYAHLVSGSIPLSVGDRVRVGDPVGQVGSTGLVTGPHLHFELRVGGATINPVSWMRANGAQ